ncbi:type II CRISPR-associated endonuclease Cas1 [Brachyspira pilosicoli]|uniref:CRISPR-associated endonuclease Cas1 n=1 Tax=Brachyspira pilosicoli TaxID=52584 RepID=A0A5C8EVL2_BRAPL|nr:type II CRISPR-associated endonuclease Cas1 [Brachyspira pilosicoli]TXJ41011.1 type II CRISPR-associated endonuclease Cas1 [Brachyspira pilosicoli]
MAWRIVIIENEGKLSTKNEQLVFTNKKYTESIPLEDIDYIILDNRQIIITHPLMNKLAEMNILLMTVNKSHEVSGILFSYWNQYRKLDTLEKQMQISPILKKQLYKTIIQQKIINQALCLKKYSLNKYDALMEFSKKIKYSNIQNMEAIAASLYFKELFSNDDFKFYRQDFKSKKIYAVNAALNYTYSIVRSVIIKYIIASGFIPYLGIFHKSKTNPFNLADDIIEPFRPIIDYHVYKFKEQLINLKFSRLDSNMRKEMHKIYFYEVYINNKWFALSSACKILIASLLKSITNNDYNIFLYPNDWRQDI